MRKRRLLLCGRPPATAHLFLIFAMGILSKDTSQTVERNPPKFVWMKLKK